VLEEVAGDVDFGDSARALYATDASIYRVRPAGVVAPKTIEDVEKTVTFAADRGVSVVARGAGSSLTGNAIGAGIVVDFERYFDDIVDVDPEAMTATVQPGVVLETLNDRLAEFGLYFPPDPSTSETCTIGGMVANDAAGPHSVAHGTTRDNLRSVECVLADGSVERFERIEGAELERACSRDDRVGEIYRTVRDVGVEYAELIDDRYPDVDRNSSGYDLENSVAADGSWVDLSKLVAGSEGTLAAITEITVDVSRRPETRAAALVFYERVRDAAAAVDSVLDADPSVVELIDDDVLRYAREAWSFEIVPPRAGASLLVEVETTTGERERRLGEVIAAASTGATVGVEPAVSDEAQETIWKIRKASNPLLNRRYGDEQSISFVEDAAIPPARLPSYLDGVDAILAEHDLDASVFGHAGQGVLHVKPLLDLRTPGDRELLRTVSEAVHELVVETGGSVSGEHGDGRLRSTYVESLYGETLYEVFTGIKRTFDPGDVFNPGTVVPTTDGHLAAVDESLRFSGYDPDPFDPALSFDAEGGFGSLVEQCNGCSKCRKEGRGVMCPSYRAIEAEGTSTRGRANMLREALDGTLGTDALTSEWFQEEVLDLCLSCKACETECPTGTDMAKLKTEAKHQRHRRSGVPLRSRLFGNVRRLNRLGSAFAPLSNWVVSRPSVRWVMEQGLGIDRRRSLPPFAAESLESWFEDHAPPAEAGDRGRVLLHPDCYVNYNHPDVGRAAVRVLERAGYEVQVLPATCCGRPSLSQGMVEKAREDAAANAETYAEYVRDDVPILSVEPSCVSAFEEYDDLLADPRGLPASVATVSEFLRDEGVIDELDVDVEVVTAAVHSHCHSKARDRSDAPGELLRAAGVETETVESTCCGMAGAFGYETEHYEISRRLGAEFEDTVADTDAEAVAVTGSSCTQQLFAFDRECIHPIQIIADGLPDR